MAEPQFILVMSIALLVLSLLRFVADMVRPKSTNGSKALFEGFSTSGILLGLVTLIIISGIFYWPSSPGISGLSRNYQLLLVGSLAMSVLVQVNVLFRKNRDHN